MDPQYFLQKNPQPCVLCLLLCFLVFLLPCLVCVAWSTFAAVENAVEDRSCSALHGENGVMEVSPLDNDLEACNCRECFLNCKYCCNFPRLAAATISARISGGKMYSEPLRADVLLSDVLRWVSNLEIKKKFNFHAKIDN